MNKLDDKTLRGHKGISWVGVSTCFFCHDGNGKFFLAKRSNKSRDEQGTWEIGGGGLKWGLTAEENMLREVKEEYNAEPKNIKFLGYRDVFRKLADGTPTHWLAIDFAVLVDPKHVKINEPDMFDDCGWFTRDNMPSPLHSQQLPFMNKYRTELDNILTVSD